MEYILGNSLKCYNCISKSSEECKHPSWHDKFEPQVCNMDQINKLADQAGGIAQQLGNAFGIDIDVKKKEVLPLVCQKVITRGMYLKFFIFRKWPLNPKKIQKIETSFLM